MAGLITWALVVLAAASCEGLHFEHMGGVPEPHGGGVTESPTTTTANYPQNSGNTGIQGKHLQNYGVKTVKTVISKAPVAGSKRVSKTGFTMQSKHYPNFLKSFYKLLLKYSSNGAKGQSSSTSYANLLNQLKSGTFFQRRYSGNVPVPTSKTQISLTLLPAHTQAPSATNTYVAASTVDMKMPSANTYSKVSTVDMKTTSQTKTYQEVPTVNIKTSLVNTYPKAPTVDKKMPPGNTYPAVPTIDMKMPPANTYPQVPNVDMEMPLVNKYPEVTNVDRKTLSANNYQEVPNVYIKTPQANNYPQVPNVDMEMPLVNKYPEVTNVDIKPLSANNYQEVPNVDTKPPPVNNNPEVPNVDIKTQQANSYPEVTNVDMKMPPVNNNPEAPNVYIKPPPANNYPEVPTVDMKIASVRNYQEVSSVDKTYLEVPPVDMKMPLANTYPEVPIVDIRPPQVDTYPEVPIVDIKTPPTDTYPEVPYVDIKPPAKTYPDVPFVDMKMPPTKTYPDVPPVDMKMPLANTYPEVPIVDIKPSQVNTYPEVPFVDMKTPPTDTYPEVPYVDAKPPAKTYPEVPAVDMKMAPAKTYPEVPPVDMKMHQANTYPEVPIVDIKPSQVNTYPEVPIVDMKTPPTDTYPEVPYADAKPPAKTYPEVPAVDMKMSPANTYPEIPPVDMKMHQANTYPEVPIVDMKMPPTKTYPDVTTVDIKKSVVKSKQIYDNQFSVKPKPYNIQTKNVLQKGKNYIPKPKTQKSVKLSGTLSSKTNLLNVLSSANKHDKVLGTIEVGGTYIPGIPSNNPSPRLYSSYPNMLPTTYGDKANIEPHNNKINSVNTLGEVSITKGKSKISIKGGQSSIVNNKVTNSKTGGHISTKPYIENSASPLKTYQSGTVKTTVIREINKPDLVSYIGAKPTTENYVSNLNQQGNKKSMVGVNAGLASTNMHMSVQNQHSEQYQASKGLSTTGSMSLKHTTKQAIPAMYPPATSTNVYNSGSTLTKKSSTQTTSSYIPILPDLVSRLTKSTYSRTATEQYLMILSLFIENLLKSLNISEPQPTYNQTTTPITPTYPLPNAKPPAYPITKAPIPYHLLPYDHSELSVSSSQTNKAVQSGGGIAHAENTRVNNNGLVTQMNGFNGQLNQNRNQYEGQTSITQNQGASINYEQQAANRGVSISNNYKQQAANHGVSISNNYKQQAANRGVSIPNNYKQQAANHGVSNSYEQQAANGGVSISNNYKQQAANHGVSNNYEQQAANHGVSITYGQQAGSISTSTTKMTGGKTCILSRVCGTDGRVYLSECFMRAPTTKACDNVCPCPVTPKPTPYVQNDVQQTIGNQRQGNEGQGIQGYGIQGQGTQGQSVQGQGVQGYGAQGQGIAGQGNQGPGTTGGVQGSYNNATAAACIKKCPVADQPVCSSLGKQYQSDCHLQCSNATKMCNAVCPCEFEEILPTMRRKLVSIDELLAANHAVGQNPYEMLVPQTPQCSCPPVNGYSLFVCTNTGKTLTACQAQCLRSTVKCQQRCPCTIEWK